MSWWGHPPGLDFHTDTKKNLIPTSLPGRSPTDLAIFSVVGCRDSQVRVGAGQDIAPTQKKNNFFSALRAEKIFFIFSKEKIKKFLPPRTCSSAGPSTPLPSGAPPRPPHPSGWGPGFIVTGLRDRDRPRERVSDYSRITDPGRAPWRAARSPRERKQLLIANTISNQNGLALLKKNLAARNVMTQMPKPLEEKNSRTKR